jgi:hypothetical protein
MSGPADVKTALGQPNLPAIALFFAPAARPSELANPSGGADPGQGPAATGSRCPGSSAGRSALPEPPRGRRMEQRARTAAFGELGAGSGLEAELELLGYG